MCCWSWLKVAGLDVCSVAGLKSLASTPQRVGPFIRPRSLASTWSRSPPPHQTIEGRWPGRVLGPALTWICRPTHGLMPLLETVEEDQRVQALLAALHPFRSTSEACQVCCQSRTSSVWSLAIETIFTAKEAGHRPFSHRPFWTFRTFSDHDVSNSTAVFGETLSSLLCPKCPKSPKSPKCPQAEAVLHLLRGLWVRRAWASCCWIRNSFDENSEVPVSCTLCASGAVCSSCRSACRSQTVGCHLSVMTLTGGGAVSTRDGPNASEPRCVLGRRQRGGPKKTTSPKQAKGVQIHLEVSP
jgi:hypothetical protein